MGKQLICDALYAWWEEAAQSPAKRGEFVGCLNAFFSVAKTAQGPFQKEQKYYYGGNVALKAGAKGDLANEAQKQAALDWWNMFVKAIVWNTGRSAGDLSQCVIAIHMECSHYTRNRCTVDSPC